jgi:phosphohistidine phosphatase SixA
MALLRALVLFVAITAAAMPASAGDREGLWQALKQGGHAVIFRHAIAPGTGDPPGFRLGDCSTQRNLSPEGRAQAAAIGAAFRQHGVAVNRVLSSRWCRARDTAALMNLAPVEDAPMLDSFFSDRAREPEQTTALKRFLADMKPGETVVMVSHQVNITALTGEAPSSGEAAVVAPVPGKPGEFTLRGWLTVAP